MLFNVSYFFSLKSLWKSNTHVFILNSIISKCYRLDAINKYTESTSNKLHKLPLQNANEFRFWNDLFMHRSWFLRGESYAGASVSRLTLTRKPFHRDLVWTDTFDLCSVSTPAGNPLVCSESRFKCRNGRCVDRSFLCNGQDNCQDNSDEELCLTTAGTSRSQKARLWCHKKDLLHWKWNIYPVHWYPTQGHAEVRDILDPSDLASHSRSCGCEQTHFNIIQLKQGQYVIN